MLSSLYPSDHIIRGGSTHKRWARALQQGQGQSLQTQKKQSYILSSICSLSNICQRDQQDRRHRQTCHHNHLPPKFWRISRLSSKPSSISPPNSSCPWFRRQEFSWHTFRVFLPRFGTSCLAHKLHRWIHPPPCCLPRRHLVGRSNRSNRIVEQIHTIV